MTRAKDKVTQPEPEEAEAQYTSPDTTGWEWDTIAEESAITVVFDTIGDEFVGQYAGEEHIDPANGKDEPFDRYTFRDGKGVLFALNQSYKLLEAMKEVQPGQWVRITYVKDIPTGRNLQPMKDFRVQVKK